MTRDCIPRTHTHTQWHELNIKQVKIQNMLRVKTTTTKTPTTKWTNKKSMKNKKWENSSWLWNGSIKLADGRENAGVPDIFCFCTLPARKMVFKLEEAELNVLREELPPKIGKIIVGEQQTATKEFIAWIMSTLHRKSVLCKEKTNSMAFDLKYHF